MRESVMRLSDNMKIFNKTAEDTLIIKCKQCRDSSDFNIHTLPLSFYYNSAFILK